MKPRQSFSSKAAAFLLILTITAVCLTGCRSVPAELPYSSAEICEETELTETVRLHPAITVETFRNRSYPLIYHLVTIDLSDRTLAITATPLSAGNTAAAGCVKGESTLSFAKRTDALVAINATPYAIPGNKPRFLTPYRKLTGLFIESGRQFSAPESRYAALGFTGEKQAFILNSQTDPLPSDTAFVFGGFWQILKDGEHCGSFKNIQDSRTAAGISKDGMTLFLLSVEGERPFSSRGLSYYDCAEILKKAGASSAIELDGGSSASLVIQGENFLSYRVSHIVANNFGITAEESVY